MPLRKNGDLEGLYEDCIDMSMEAMVSSQRSFDTITELMAASIVFEQTGEIEKREGVDRLILALHLRRGGR